MNGCKLLVILGITLLQVVVFFLCWDTAVTIAHDMGREQHGGVAFGLGVAYGAWLLSLMFLIGTSTSVLSERRALRWGTLALLVSFWVLWVWPSLANYPIRGSTLFLLGALILTLGSGFLAPFASRRCGSRRSGQL